MTMPISERSASPDTNSNTPNKRASKACTRCRRHRTKCVPLLDKPGIPPCQSCTRLQVESECIFAPRGQSAPDRAHRRRQRNILPLLRDPESSASPSRSISTRNHLPSPTSSNRELHTNTRVPEPPRLNVANVDSGELPPVPEVVEAIRRSTASYFQLGFLHKALFVERYTRDPKATSTFLLLAICSIAAPFTPVLVDRYGGKKKATDTFLASAQKMIGNEMIEPSLERAQAFLLLGVAEWGQGNGPKAWMLIGTAVRMAGFLGLHREATYQLPPNPTPDEVIESEVARRTFWAITCHENLLSGQSRPIFVSLGEIDVLLPCEESDFTFGIQPLFRASLTGTLGTQQNAVNLSEPRSLFASLVQVKILWSLTARHACRAVDKAAFSPWTASSQSLLTALTDFETGLPPRHRFSMTNLRGMMVEGVDLAFLSITLITRLSHIVIRRMYLSSMAVAMDPEVTSNMTASNRQFWQTMAEEMVENSEQLLSQVKTFFGMRPLQEGFPPIMVFGIFMSGNIFSYLWKWPELCPARAQNAKALFQRCVNMLEQLSDSWPVAAQWHAALKAAGVNNERHRGHFRATVRQEKTLDDELGGIYGPASQANTVLSPGSRQRIEVALPTAALAPAAVEQNESLFQMPAANGIQPYDNVVLGDFSESSFDASHLDNDLLFDTFGEDLSAFMQGAMPTIEADSDAAWIWGR